NAGKYVISVEIKEGDNYSSATLELPDTLTIEKATPTRDLLGYSPEDFTATYTGKPQPVVVTVQDDAVGLGGITVLYNDDATTPTNAGEYVITVEIKEGENYSSATLDLQKTLTIEKAPPTLDLLGYAQENLKTTYNGSPQPVPAPKEVEGMGRITVLYNEEPEPPINAGDYVITVKIDETGESYSSATLELGTLTIEKATPIPDLLSYSLDDFEKTYNGEQQHVDVTVQDDVVGLGGITVLYNDDATTPTNAGDYVITVKIEDGENYTSATIELQKTLTIEKAPPILDLLSYSLDDFEKTYTGTTQPVDVKKQDDAVGLGDIATVLYNGEPELPTNAGEYIVTVEIEDGKNYTSATLELPDTLTIGKAQLKPGDLKMTPTKATYDEQQHGVTVQPRFPCDKTCADMGDVTVFYDGKTEMPVKTGEYLVTVTITEGENYQSVTTPMPLGIFQIRQPTTLRDTVCLNEAYSRHGFTLPEQAKNGLFTHADTIRGELYDSIVHLKLLVYDSILFSVDNFIACADDREAAVEFDLNENSAAPSRYSLTFGKAQRFFADNVENAPLPAAIPMLNVRPDVYSATLRLSNGKCHSKELPFTITVHYPSSIMKQKWNNVIALYKSEYEFSSYQWIKDGVEIPGATLPYLYTPPMLDFSAGYTVLLTRTDGVTLPACSCKLAPPTPQQEESIAAYPTVMDKGADITILSLQQGEAITRNTLGAGVSRQKFSAGTARIGAPAQAGVYFVELQVDGEKTKTVKILVK
ncbi:MAG: MBG domain-containing protein, partial [Prevotellaceae bacterium]|nr:MBG domain-containing protein [Prevotellaceae bacterium]